MDNGQATPVEPEVLPRYHQPGPTLRFDMRSTFHSPFFWILVGSGATLLAVYAFHKMGKDRR